MNQVRDINLEIGAIFIKFKPIGAFPSFDFCTDHMKFQPLVDEAAHTLIKVHYCRDEISSQGLGTCIYDSEVLWKIFENSTHYSIELRVRPDAATPNRLLRMRKDWKEGVLYCADVKGYKQLGPIAGYPVDEVLVMNILSQSIGIETHACGLDDNGQGIVFIGESGAGKSTLANLWKGNSGVRLLSDDRIIVRRRQGRFFAYGTPWHGDAGACENSFVEIKKIFFLKGHDRCFTRPMNVMESASRMFVCCFPTFWSHKGLSFTLECIDQIVSEIPCYELSFIRDRSTIRFIREIHRAKTTCPTS